MTAPYEVTDYATAAGLVHHGLGITLMPATPAAAYPDLVPVPLHPVITWTLSLTTRTDLQLTPAAAALADTPLTEYLQRRVANGRKGSSGDSVGDAISGKRTR
ncbi:LysR substrate-binding domain-containing protein [Nocardia sp. NPDC049707]|uniref:LysR substrate-binding domain-containing protein n=1 Tax=Nocardia sp. NPDC049707 TaxID=3154735 RepID=UPI0034292B50